MNVKLSGVQVCELVTANQILFLAGCGRRRMDADRLGVYLDRSKESHFYVPESEGNPHTTLFVDEGSYAGALHSYIGQRPASQAPIMETDVGQSETWCEYVDMGDLMKVLVAKLCGDVPYTAGPYIGRGRNQRHEMSQSIEYLRKWSAEHPDHALKFI